MRTGPEVNGSVFLVCSVLTDSVSHVWGCVWGGPFNVSVWHLLSSIPSPELVLAQTSSDPVLSRSNVEAGMSEFPPPGSDFKEEEEEHEEEAGADVQDHTETHVHAVKTKTQDPHTSSCSSFPHVPSHLPPPLHPVSLVSWSRFRLLFSFLLWLLPLSSSSSFSSVLLLRPAGLYWIRVWRRCGESWGSQGVLGGQVGGCVVMSEKAEDVVLVPDVDAVFLLVAGGAEGGAWPRSFREEGVVTQRAWRREGGGGGLTDFTALNYLMNFSSFLQPLNFMTSQCDII